MAKRNSISISKIMSTKMRAVGFLVVLFPCSICLAQNTNADSTSSISGRVTIAGKGAAGVSVVAELRTSPFDNKTIAKSTTDDEGNYRLTGLAAGRYMITPIARAFVVAASETFKQPEQAVNVAEKESITKIDFALVRGGVITGRVTDLEGHPIIGEKVNVVAKGAAGDSGPMAFLPTRKNQTDDRGVYRLYGLGPGSYKVSVGQAPAGGGGVNIMGMGGSQYEKTFYPGVTEESKATLVEINEGTEASNIDITLGKLDRGFSASGRVIDAESSKPVVNTYVGYSSVNAANQQLGAMNFTGVQTDANGKFRLEGIQPGHYAAFTLGVGQENSAYSDPAPFDVSDGDVTGIEIKVRNGATIEGVAVIENNIDPAVAALLQSVSLLAYVADEKSTTAPSYSRGTINPDGSFRFAGLAPGKARINVMTIGTQKKGLQLVRTELEGVEQSEGIELTAGAHISGVRLVFAYATGKIRGEVRLEGREIPAGTVFALSYHAVGAEKTRHFIEVDARGHFFADEVPPGTYELTVGPFAGGPAFDPETRTITVANGAETQVTIVVSLAAKKEGP